MIFNCLSTREAAIYGLSSGAQAGSGNPSNGKIMSYRPENASNAAVQLGVGVIIISIIILPETGG